MQERICVMRHRNLCIPYYPVHVHFVSRFTFKYIHIFVFDNVIRLLFIFYFIIPNDKILLLFFICSEKKTLNEKRKLHFNVIFYSKNKR